MREGEEREEKRGERGSSFVASLTLVLSGAVPADGPTAAPYQPPALMGNA